MLAALGQNGGLGLTVAAAGRTRGSAGPGVFVVDPGLEAGVATLADGKVDCVPPPLAEIRGLQALASVHEHAADALVRELLDLTTKLGFVQPAVPKPERQRRIFGVRPGKGRPQTIKCSAHGGSFLTGERAQRAPAGHRQRRGMVRGATCG